MGRRSRKMPQKANKNDSDSIEVFSGRQLFNTSGTINTVSTINISPASFTRALAVADIFQFYRFTRIKVIQPPVAFNNTNVTAAIVHAYAPGSGFDTAPTTYAQLVELPKMLYHGQSKTIETNMTLNRQDLLKHVQLPWFKTIAGSPDAQFEIQGNLYNIAIYTTQSFIVEYTVEFQSPNLAGQSPLERLLVKQQCQDPQAHSNPSDPNISNRTPGERGSVDDARTQVTIGGFKYVMLPKQ